MIKKLNLSIKPSLQGTSIVTMFSSHFLDFTYSNEEELFEKEKARDRKSHASPAVPQFGLPAISSSSSYSSFSYIDESVGNITETFSIWREFKNAPKELWIILICKLCESFSFISEDFIFMIFFTDEFQLTDVECGTLYSMAAGLTFVYGLIFSGYMIDNAGVKNCMLLGSLLLSVARLLISTIDTKEDLYLVFSTVAPLGLSLCICSS